MGFFRGILLRRYSSELKPCCPGFLLQETSVSVGRYLMLASPIEGVFFPSQGYEHGNCNTFEIVLFLCLRPGDGCGWRPYVLSCVCHSSHAVSAHKYVFSYEFDSWCSQAWARMTLIPTGSRLMICIATIIEKTQDVGHSCRFFFLHNPHSQSLLHKALELFIEYLAHSSFKDFAPANCFYWGINYVF